MLKVPNSALVSSKFQLSPNSDEPQLPLPEAVIKESEQEVSQFLVLSVKPKE